MTYFNELEGRVIKAVYMDEDNLQFDTDAGLVSYTVEGDCCSHSFFYDFYGVEKLVGSKVIRVEDVPLDPTDLKAKNDSYEEIKVYGYRIVFEGEYGEQSAVFSFRNSSNGYYGGWAEKVDKNSVIARKITNDVMGM